MSYLNEFRTQCKAGRMVKHPTISYNVYLSTDDKWYAKSNECPLNHNANVLQDLFDNRWSLVPIIEDFPRRTRDSSGIIHATTGSIYNLHWACGPLSNGTRAQGMIITCPLCCKALGMDMVPKPNMISDDFNYDETPMTPWPTTPSPPKGYENCEMWRVLPPNSECSWWHVLPLVPDRMNEVIDLYALPNFGLVGFTDADAKQVVCNVPGPWLQRKVDGHLWACAGDTERIPAVWAVIDRGPSSTDKS